MFAPNGKVRILKNVDCDVSGVNVLSFANEAAEQAYYISKTKYNYENCRVTDEVGFAGTLIVPGTPEQFYDCNYIMYQNTQFSTKWFYAYITSTPLAINSGATQITYTIDAFRTWYWEWSLGTCMVEREIVSDDTTGKWLIPEGLETGEFVCVNKGDLIGDADWTPYLLVNYTYSPPSDDEDASAYTITYSDGTVASLPGANPVFAGGKMVEGIYQGNSIYAWQLLPTTVPDINTYIKNLVGNGQVSSIQTINIVPKFLAERYTGQVITVYDKARSLTIDMPTSPSNFSGTTPGWSAYTPKNNKLLTAEFNYVTVVNNEGGAIELDYEYFKDVAAPKVKMYGQSAGGKPSVRLLPLNYKGQEENTLFCLDITDFPVASFQYSTFANDWNANRASNTIDYQDFSYKNYNPIDALIKATKDVSTGKTPTTGYVSGDILRGGLATIPNMVGAVGSGITRNGINPVNILNSLNPVNTDIAREQKLAQVTDHARIPNSVSGTATPNMSWSMGVQKYQYEQMQITVEAAKRIDDYFSAVGYKINQVKVPDISSRPHWNYVKCVDPVILGNLPMEAKQAIYQQFSSGVRIWHNPSDFLNYALNNK